MASTKEECELKSLLIIYEKCDLTSAIEPLLRSIKEPHAWMDTVDTVFVHGHLYNSFLEAVRNGITPEDIGCTHNKLRDADLLVNVFELVTRTYLRTNDPSTLVTLRLFYTELDMALEPLDYTQVLIWSTDIKIAYKIALLVGVATVYVNCVDIALKPVRPEYETRYCYAEVVNDIHYEVLTSKSMAIVISASTLPPTCRSKYSAHMLPNRQRRSH
ncbi:uncharacterized protein LOC115629538 [Scaptodrosophila lebanonensis]|uniref:Uncharacterized protein LOC115629538 n=1 Tax=Drosophila lebanonensis TaxID=7225 RepID=A0A6J2U422_DROLE|nr:uncharacterized protein LOC115629538 [Scaptodrosophila lebanonensis]